MARTLESQLVGQLEYLALASKEAMLASYGRNDHDIGERLRLAQVALNNARAVMAKIAKRDLSRAAIARRK